MKIIAALIAALLALAGAIVSKISGTLALVVTAAWLIGIPEAHQYVAMLWWAFGWSTLAAVVGIVGISVLSDTD